MNSPKTISEGIARNRKPRCLIVRPAKARAAHAGDEIVYTRSLEYLAQTMQVDVCELYSISRPKQLFEIAKGAPPEVTRYIGSENRERVNQSIQSTRPEVVCFFNEVTFPFLSISKSAGIASVLAAHNVHSVVAATDPAGWTRIFQPLAARFERKWYDDIAAELVCISKLDVEGLKSAGLTRSRIFVAPPGCPAPCDLSDTAEPIPDIVLTGSYAWWRKRRDLESFARGVSLPTKIIAFDDIAKSILGPQAISPTDVFLDWKSGIRFGLITDRFLGGFKLKALEYVARNCAVLSACDISLEFSDLPHAEIFVRKISAKAEAWQTMQEIIRLPNVVQRFREFKEACVTKFDWNSCLTPLHTAIETALSANSVK
ncbi:hypothetical protein ABH973_004007 [Bradyrhizobium ottawaense]|uniref:hypothetical protein n=1 Tax=Bradyrhizobium ottawaense TaxID=931866 RepID=UPI00351983B3